MSSELRFTPLCGVHSESPLCYLLQLDELVILLDCGWDHTYNTTMLEPLKAVANTIDIG
jgi:cleavage and polyadenylation specificity factor subunit 2